MQRKIFRIEQTISGKRPSASSTAAERGMADEIRSLRAQLHVQSQDATVDRMRSLKMELVHIRDTIASNKRELAGLIGDGKERRMTRAADELRAAVKGMEIGTDKVLKAAEIVDESARALTAALQDDFKRGLAQEIQDQVVDIFEACNFQDISGQRIGKAIATLATVEAQVTAALERYNNIGIPAAPAAPAPSDGLLNGPKLNSDTGHATQHEIDMMFGT